METEAQTNKEIIRYTDRGMLSNMEKTIKGNDTSTNKEKKIEHRQTN
jgi:hypothetical protein